MKVSDSALIPRKFFVTAGRGLSKVSKLNAFDRALIDAGIGNCNLVPVSSILPSGAEECEVRDISAGSIVFVVMARMDGSEGEKLGAGIAWAWEDGGSFGVVVEAHDNMDHEKLKTTLNDRLNEMAVMRNIRLKNVKYRIESLSVPKGFYGSVVAALVFLPQSMTY
ncbi:pyruvoyl-dependent arginine decarboxylase [Candidatus Bathyarchaeota archaeon]|nr:pyruvoyl-dependent arginine decarboxylase [Candidatus Bathyarchaeota archaeon]MBS7613964.1 pyruvoyl-dependent arginine decarboxylase [Candidatus Bathyarchaeota archaeon]MBS7617084.1 pyruvoyl-dependent arginine decarboxylase [Candidatus Bathyarchaeota archaeon]